MNTGTEEAASTGWKELGTDERFAMIQLGGAVPVKDYSIFEDFEIIELTGEIPD